MELEKVLPTRGQLERQLSQTLQSLFRQQFGQVPSKVTCHLFGDKLAIVAEDTVTSIERILFQNAKIDLARSIRVAINQAFTNKIKEVIAKIVKVEVVDIISNSAIDTGYLGIIVFLENRPEIRLRKK